MLEAMCSGGRSRLGTLQCHRSKRSFFIHTAFFTPSALQVWERTFEANRVFLAYAAIAQFG